MLGNIAAEIVASIADGIATIVKAIFQPNDSTIYATAMGYVAKEMSIDASIIADAVALARVGNNSAANAHIAAAAA